MYSDYRYYVHPYSVYYPMQPVFQPYYMNQGPYHQTPAPHRQQPIQGRATWTEGGAVTQCNIPWSENEYMTVAVGENAPYACGQSLKIRNPSMPGREIIATVVDKVPGYQENEINLHRRAFAALGVAPSMGVMNVEIIQAPELEEEKWGKYLVEVVQTAYPEYDVTEYNSIRKNNVSPTQIRETFEFILENDEEELVIRGNVAYNPETDRVLAFDIAEVE